MEASRYRLVLAAALVTGVVGCDDGADTSSGGGAGSAVSSGSASDAAPQGSTGAAGQPIDGPRVALRVSARADLIAGGAAARVASRIDVPLSQARSRASWTLSIGEQAFDLAAADLLVLPAIEDPARAAVAVWRVPAGAEAGEPVRATLDGAVVFEGTLGSPTGALARVDVAPVVVHASTGEGPDPLAVESAFRRFETLYRDACQIELVVHPSSTLVLDGFQALEELDMLALDDASAIEALRGATGREVGVAMSTRMAPLGEGASAAAPPFTRIVRAVVFTHHQSEEQASAISPSYFHHDTIATLHPGSPSFYPGPELAWFWIDPSVDFAAQTWPEMTAVERDRSYATYFGADHLEAFGHELGHLLGLPHPTDSSEIDAGPGTLAANLMDPVDDCVPDCAVHISPQQCEIMLSGMTGFVTPF